MEQSLIMISGIANPDEIERFLYKKKYILKVEKMCSAHIMVEAENEQKARDKAEDLKYHFHLAWK